MDDEECLPENSSLNVYLRDLGFSDIQISRKIAQKPRSFQFEVSKPKTKRPKVETIDEDVIEQIGIIISTQMLFEEDILKIEKLLSKFEVVKTGMLRSIFKDLFGIAIIFLGLCLYWVIGYFAFLFVSSFYAYNAAYYMKRKYFYRIRLKKLSSVIQSNFILLKKTAKFIDENTLIQSKFVNNRNPTEFLQGFDLYKNFKNDFLFCINEMINIFIRSTQKLIYRIPLYDYIENTEYYLCNNLKKDNESVNLSKLYEIYLLLQSEFLQRLILSLIPNIRLSTNNDFNEINEILTETCLSLLKIKKIINKKFKFFYLNGIHAPNAQVEFKFQKKNSISENTYVKDFLLNIHETSKNFQNLLIKCRFLEDSIKSEKLPEFVENELVEMQSSVNSCQRNISDCLILLKRSTALTEKQNDVALQKPEEFENSNDKLNAVEVGYTDLDPKIEDEIYEMFSSNKNSDSNLSDKEHWDLGDRLEEKLKKEYYKGVMKELKIKLVEKDICWKKREKELLKKKGLVDINEEMIKNENESINMGNSNEFDYESDHESKTPQNFKNDFKKIFSLENENFDLNNYKFEEKVAFEDQNVQCLQVLEKNCLDSIPLESSGNIITAKSRNLMLDAENTNFENIESHFGAFKTDLLQDLDKARQKMIKSNFRVDEELFCDSDEGEPS